MKNENNTLKAEKYLIIGRRIIVPCLILWILSEIIFYGLDYRISIIFMNLLGTIGIIGGIIGIVGIYLTFKNPKPKVKKF